MQKNKTIASKKPNTQRWQMLVKILSIISSTNLRELKRAVDTINNVK